MGDEVILPGGLRIENWDPPKDSGLSKFTEVVEFDAFEFESNFFDLKLYTIFEDGTVEEVWDGSAFADAYSLSSRSAIAFPNPGYHYVIRRDAGWPRDFVLDGRADVQEVAPSWTSPPTISGAAAVDATLTVSHDDPIGPLPITVTYQWTRDGVDIAGATADTYTLVLADEGALIRCRATATNDFGSDSATSDPVGPVFDAPAFTVAPVASGTATEGETVSTTDGTYTGTAPVTVTYQWTRGGVDIGGATSSTYVLQAADVGELIACDVTATNDAGSDTATSNDLGPVDSAALIETDLLIQFEADAASIAIVGGGGADQNDATVWGDQNAGSGPHDATQADAAERPTYEATGGPDGGAALALGAQSRLGDGHFNLPDPVAAVASPHTYYVVLNIAALAGVQALLDFNTGREILYAYRSGAVQMYDGTSFRVFGSATTGWQCLTFQAATSASRVFRGRAQLGTDQGWAGDRALAGTASLGDNLGAGNRVNGHIAACLIYDREHDATERGQVWNYLANLYPLIGL